MTKPLYTADRIGVWHAVPPTSEFGREIRCGCGAIFIVRNPLIEKRPHKDSYCAGCKGAEEQEAKTQEQE
jgi:hypothetical protein